MADSAAAKRDAISASLAAYLGELRLAGHHWERKPVGSADGEAGWNARQVAEHIAGAGTFFGSALARTIGAQPIQPQPFQFAIAADAVPATEAAYQKLLDVASQVKDEQLAVEIELPRLGSRTAGGIIDMVAAHLLDHANQLKSLRT